jgi:hypothetical protein
VGGVTSIVLKNEFPKAITIKKYGRFWAVYADSNLLAVTVYKKGANSIKSLINGLLSHVIANSTK